MKKLLIYVVLVNLSIFSIAGGFLANFKTPIRTGYARDCNVNVNIKVTEGPTQVYIWIDNEQRINSSTNKDKYAFGGAGFTNTEIVYQNGYAEKDVLIKVTGIKDDTEYLPATGTVHVTNWDCNHAPFGVFPLDYSYDISLAMQKNPNGKPYEDPNDKPVDDPNGPSTGNIDHTVPDGANAPENCPTGFNIKVEAHENASKVTLTWQAPPVNSKPETTLTSHVNSYHIMRATDQNVSLRTNGYGEVGFVSEPTHTYSENVANGHSYVYAIQTYDAQGNMGQLCNGTSIDLTDPKNPKVAGDDVQDAASTGGSSSSDDECFSNCDNSVKTGNWLTDPVRLSIVKVLCTLICMMNDLTGWMTNTFFQSTFEAFIPIKHVFATTRYFFN